jgi:signal transduction histidine kinase
MCLPLTYYDQEREALTPFGVLNASRLPGAPPFTSEDLEYLTRFAGQLSIAVANSVAFQAERKRSEQLALVNTLIREITGNLSRSRILQTAVRRIHEAFRFPVVLVLEPDASAGSARVAAAVSAAPAATLRAAFPLGEGMVGRALSESRTVVVPDVAAGHDEAPLVPSTRSRVAVPVVAGGEAVALLLVESDAPRAFGRGDVITLETLADGIGITLRNAELYQALEQTNARLVELDRTKSELVNIVAHDFRAPLAGVLGYAELLEWKPEAPEGERVEHARNIIQAATHMAALVDKTLKTTRLETGQFPFDFALVDLGACLREVVRRHPPDPRHPLTADIPEDPLPAWADGARVVEVIENLLTNAAKYSPEGGPIRLETKVEGETVTIAVEDRGIGIAAPDLGRLFRPFSRVRDKATQEIEGSGLGLYICERVVRAHGGRFRVDSEPGRGSRFAFTLPLFGASAQSRPPFVLVAAGHAGTRRAVRRVAEELGFAVHEVGDGVEAVEEAARLLPLALVLDRVLPRMRAEEVAERLKSSDATAGIPLILLAAEPDTRSRPGLFDAFVAKPLDPKVLTEALEPVLRAAGPLTSPQSGP